MITKQAELKKRAYTSSLKSRALSILIYLIDRSNKDLTCFPSIPTMAAELHIGTSTVKRALHELIDAGFIQKEARFRENNRGQSSNLYTLIFNEQAPEPKSNRENNPDLGNNIEPQTAPAENRSTQHITFADIAVTTKAEMQPQSLPQEDVATASAQQEMSPHVFNLRTPVQHTYIYPVYKHRQSFYHLALRKLHYMAAENCHWTGAESSLIPP